MAVSALILTARFAGRIPLTTPTQTANTTEPAASHGGITEMVETEPAMPRIPPNAPLPPEGGKEIDQSGCAVTHAKAQDAASSPMMPASIRNMARI